MWYENGAKRLTSDLDDLRECEELLDGGMDTVEMLREVRLNQMLIESQSVATIDPELLLTRLLEISPHNPKFPIP